MPASGLRAVSVAVATAVLSATAWVSLASPASAAAPIAVDDHRTMYAGQGRSINVLKNDSDPDGDDLAVCRVQETETEDYYAFIEEGRLFVVVLDGAADEITITYYACDFESLVPATLTITVKPVFRPTVTKLDRPGRLRVTNDNDKVVHFLWGKFGEDRPDGRVRVQPEDSVVIAVHRRTIDWLAYLGNAVFIGAGHVRGIELPDRADVSERSTTTFSRGELKRWNAQR